MYQRLMFIQFCSLVTTIETSLKLLAADILYNEGWVLFTGVQVVMQLVRLLPDGHRMKREVDMALDSVSETMTPMHYHLREIIISTYRQVQRISP